MRRSVLLVLVLTMAACGQDAADVHFADGPDGMATSAGVAPATETVLPSAAPATAEPAPATSAPATGAQPVTPGPAPATPEPTPSASPDGPRELGQDEDAEVGRPYRYNLYTHCGIATTWFDGRWWNAVPPQGDGHGNPPPEWGNPYQEGVIVLAAEDRLEFTGDQGQRASFRPRPQEQGAPPPCA